MQECKRVCDICKQDIRKYKFWGLRKFRRGDDDQLVAKNWRGYECCEDCVELIEKLNYRLDRYCADEVRKLKDARRALFSTEPRDAI